jgi:hypothetical protein
MSVPRGGGIDLLEHAQLRALFWLQAGLLGAAGGPSAPLAGSSCLATFRSTWMAWAIRRTMT